MSSEQRDIRPEIKDFGKIEFNPPSPFLSEGGIPVYIFDGEKHNVCRVDIIFYCGEYEQPQQLVAQVTAAQMVEASTKKSSVTVSEMFDFYGGWVQQSVSYHYSIFTLYSPCRTFSKLLPLFIETITSPRFGSRDIARYNRQGAENLKIREKKVEAISSKIFKEKLFDNHPYGKEASVNDFANIDKEVLRNYYQEWFVAENCNVIFSGAIDDDMVKMLDRELLNISSNTLPERNTKEVKPRTNSQLLFVENVDKAIQSSVRMGAIAINRNHDDYLKLHILTSVLGGYFGSRLNRSIREDKGYTYGINSWLMGLPDAAYIAIASQTAIAYTKPLVDAVFVEIEKLKTEVISDEEMKNVRGYLLGDLISIFDNRFTRADSLISMLINKIPLDYINRRAELIREITPQILLETAQKHLPCKEMITVVAGGGM